MEKTVCSVDRLIILVPGPFQGHLTPMLQLGSILQSRGFSITVAHAQFNRPNSVCHPLFEFLPIEDGLTDDAVRSGDLISLVSTLNANCGSVLEECLIGKKEIACIIYDGLMYFSEAVAQRLKVPSMVLHTNSAASSLALFFLYNLKAKDYVPLQGSVLQDLVPELHPLRYKDLPISKFGEFDDLLKLIDLISNIRTSSAIVWNTVEFLEESLLDELRQKYHVPIYYALGPLHMFVSAATSSTTGLFEEDHECIPWLDKQRPNSVLYISMGSIASVDEEQLAEMAIGLVNSKQPFLWVMREDSPPTWSKSVRGRLEEIGRIVKWAPQKKVLSHRAVGGFWSHCGWNSTLESICEGVPMICQPCFGDQKTNARYLTEVWRVWMEMDEGGIERGIVERVVRSLMVEGEGEDMRERMIEMKNKVECTISDGGSSNNSLNNLIKLLEVI